MDAISYEYTKQRKQFGLHPTFGDSQSINQSIEPEPDTPEAISSFDQNEANQFTPLSPLMAENLPPPKSSSQWMESINQSVSLDCIPTQSFHSINTERFVQHQKSISHIDGAWPSDIKTNEFVDRQRYVRRLINEPSFQTTVPVLTKTAESIIQSNNTIDCYQQYFSNNSINNQSENPEEEYASKPPSAKTVCVFRDPNQSNNQTNNQTINRAATKISWHPESPTKLAVSYSVMSFQSNNQSSTSNTSNNQSNNQTNNHAYIWDLTSPNHPDATLVPPSSLSSISFNPRSPDHLIGGCFNGQLCFFDLRKGSAPVEVSLLEKSHHDPVYDVYWIQSRTGNEICSLSTDGQLLFWDVRKLKKGWMDCMLLTDQSGQSSKEAAKDANQSINQAGNQMVFGGCSMEYKSDAGATRFLIGTEQGVCILADRKAKKDAESTKSIKAMYGTINQSNNQSNPSNNQPINQSLPSNGAHYGPVCSIQRSPFNVKIFLTCGDWCAKIWMEDLREPILVTRSNNQSINQTSNQSNNQTAHRSSVLGTTQNLNQTLNQTINQSNNQSMNPPIIQSGNQTNNQYVTAGAWSPSRPGVFFLAKSDGSFDVYDLVRKSESPVFTQKVCDCEITSLKVSANGKYVALGDANGSVTILQLSRGLIEQSNNEKVFITNLFEREAKREKALEVKKMQARKVAPSATQSKETAKDQTIIEQSINQSNNQNEIETNEIKESIARAEEDFWILIDQSKSDMEETKESNDPSFVANPVSVEESKEEMDQQEEKTNE